MPAERLLAGWGRAAPSCATVRFPRSADEVAAALAEAGPRGVLARGLGRSYGDAAQNGGGTVLLTEGLDRILAVDLGADRVRVQAGVRLEDLMAAMVPLGRWPAVTPGTRQVSIGGAVGSDIHGKNHHRDGTFGANVEHLVLATPARGLVHTGPDEDPEVFWATVGGMGLTGVVVEATVRLSRIETPLMRVDTRRAGDLDELMAAMVEADGRYRYSVAWIDCRRGGGSWDGVSWSAPSTPDATSCPPAWRARRRCASPPTEASGRPRGGPAGC
jgi:decaprenylphospho-beta-D-ribofuranose 2-oxidase